MVYYHIHFSFSVFTLYPFPTKVLQVWYMNKALEMVAMPAKIEFLMKVGEGGGETKGKEGISPMVARKGGEQI